MSFVQLLMFGLVVAVWILLYSIWREVDVYLLIGEKAGDAQPQNLFEIIERSKARHIVQMHNGEAQR